jgi:hypothetical protein
MRLRLILSHHDKQAIFESSHARVRRACLLRPVDRVVPLQ